MGKELLQTFPIARDVITTLDNVLQSLNETPPWLLFDELIQERSTEHLRLPEFSQPLVTALQLALLAVMETWHIRPEMVVGYSSGEIAAAAACGLLTPEEAIKVAYFRGKASLAVPGQNLGMLAVGIGQHDVQVFLKKYKRVKVACVNSPNSVTLSGERQDLNDVQENIKAAGHFTRFLQVNLAYHSEYMADIADHYLRMLKESSEGLSSNVVANNVSFFSSVTGKRLEHITDAKYWHNNMVCPVQFCKAVESMIQEGGADCLIELGPSGALASPISQIKMSLGNLAASIQYNATLTRGKDSIKPLFELAGCMFLAGVDINMPKVNSLDFAERPRLITDLPNYQWNHSIKYWHESLASQDWRYRRFPVHDLLGTKVLGTSWQSPSFRRILHLKHLPWIRDHCIGSDIVFPASGYIAMAVEAMFQTAHSLGIISGIKHVSSVSYRLRDVRMLRALILQEDADHHLYLLLSPTQGPRNPWFHFSIQTLRDGT